MDILFFMRIYLEHKSNSVYKKCCIDKKEQHWNNEQLVAFILNSSGIYKNESVVCDAGTGVVPEHRGKRVFSSLFEYT